MRAALLQLTSSDDPAENLTVVARMMAEAAREGAELICTPEMTNCLTFSRSRQEAVLRGEADDPTLAGLRDRAAKLGVWLSIGSLGLRAGDGDGRFANRSFLIDPGGEIIARYDKIHMFDVTVSETESYSESSAYRPGDRAVIAETPLARIGLTICYDLRFPHLHRALAQAGAEILLIPAAFTVPTGRAHWEVLLRARAIETGAFILAAAQTGLHPQNAPGRERRTWGHSMAIDPWGTVLVAAGTAPGISLVDLDLAAVKYARRRIPALTHDRKFSGP